MRGTFEISEFSDLCIEFVLRLRMQLKRSATSHDLYNIAGSCCPVHSGVVAAFQEILS